MARVGIAGTTIREIAREAGYSTGILAHYFADREDILSSALVQAHRRVRARGDASIADRRGLAALRLLMIESLPLTEESRLENTIEVCFWGEAVGNRPLMEIQNIEVDGFCARIRALVLQAGEDGELDPAIDVEQAVRQFLILNDAICLQSVMQPASAERETLLGLLDALIASLRRRTPDPRGRRSPRRRPVSH